jgi:hypothetical protein
MKNFNFLFNQFKKKYISFDFGRIDLLERMCIQKLIGENKALFKLDLFIDLIFGMNDL